MMSDKVKFNYSTIIPEIKLLVFCCLLCFAQSAYSQNNTLVDCLGIEKGLSNSAVRCVFQDHNGFLWFGTYDGLNRYDGYDFKIFRNSDGDTTTIANSWINTITEDHNQKLWVGTRQGVSIYNMVSGKFSGVYYKPANHHAQPQKISDNTKAIEVDAKGNVFVETEYRGLIKFEKDNYGVGKVVPFNIGKAGDTYNVQALCISPDQCVWVFIEGHGLYRYDRELNRLKLVNNNLRTATNMLYDSFGLWIADENGLHQYHIATNRFDNFYKLSSNQLTSARITNLLSVKNNELWIATDGGGINILNELTGKFRYLTSGGGKSSLTSNAVYALYSDRESRKWIGTLRGGVNIIDPFKANFNNVQHDASAENSLVNNFVLSLCEDTPDKLWIGTDGGGASLWDRKNNRFTNFTHRIDDATSIGGDFVTSIKKDFKNNIWLATYEGGISRYIPQTGKFERYYGFTSDHTPVNSLFWLLYEDGRKNLWAGSIQYGIYLFNRAANRFEIFDASLKDVLILKEDKSGQMWGGGWSRLIRIDWKTRQYQRYFVGKPVRSIFEDSKGQFWVGTEGGLILFDRVKNTIIKKYTTKDGLSNDHVLNIQEDKAGNLWISTYAGLSRFNIDSKTFKTYSQTDGLPGNEFNYNASVALSSGELAFGGINGLSLFYPEQISQLRVDPNIVFTGLKINNQPSEQSPSYISKQSNDEVQQITVPYDQAIFTFDFTATEYPYADRINYRYKMDGWDRTWNNSGKIRSATYTNLAPGSYVFRVNCTNRDGVWTKKQIYIQVIVLPPWYRTWWSYLIYLVLIIAAVYGFVWYRERRIGLEYEVKLAKANEKRQADIQEKEREIHENRLEFFTSISHEFRTPLSLIINPIKDMLARAQAGKDADLNIIYRNARRLLSLVDQLLLFRKADSGMAQMKVVPLNIFQLCKEVYLCFAQQARSAGIQYNLSAEFEDLIIYADREKLEIILFNLVSNAIKFTPPNGSVSLELLQTADGVEIKVTDSGCGISDETGEKLFEKFYQSRANGRPVKAGFGIGLYLAHQFTSEHQGALTYTSKIGAGTTFRLALKKGHQHFPSEMIGNEDFSESVFLEELVQDGRDLSSDDLGADDNFKATNIFTDSKIILTIDDDKEIRNYIRSIFSPQYVVYEAADAEAGMLMVKDKTPDLVICDVMMPGMNGIEWCNWLKQNPSYSYIPVILLTASSSSENKLKGLDCGADDYISKPFEKELLLARVANLLTTRNNLRSYFYNEITLQSNTVAISEEYKVFFQNCIDIVEKHLADEKFNIKVLAAEIGMSHSNLYRKVKSMSGYTINSFIRLIRLRKAAEMLINTEYNVNQVAIETGFSNIRYFRAQFFKLFGVNPSEFVRRNRPVFKKRFNVKL